jgi:membrane fusion protein (multidrug efflux system)
MKPTQIATLILAASSTLGLSACGVGEAKVAEAAVTALPVEVATPGKVDIFATYHTTSAIAADAEATALAKVEGEVVEILVEEGDFVEAGQILAKLDGDRLRLELRQAKSLLDKVSKEYERNVQLQKKSLVSASAVEGLSYELDSLNSSYKLKKLYYNYTNIRAPISGVVSSRDIKLGQHIDVNAGAFRITDASRLVAYLKIPQSELAKFSPGHVAEIRVDAMPEETFTATIARISPTVDTTNGTFRATAYISNESGSLAPGMFGRFNIAYEKHVAALTIPAIALVVEDNEAIVFVVENGAAVRRRVVTGIQSDGLIEILDGLGEDEQIVVTGQGSLRDGSKVFASIPASGTITG